MTFTSTRNDEVRCDARQAIIKGLADDGGLFVPMKIPFMEDIYVYAGLPYKELAKKIISLYFEDIDISDCVDKAYNDNFDDLEITPLKKIGDKYFLELFHGPTSAFKDLALQFLPQIMNKCRSDDKDIVILSATSGDTGKAALEGFKDVEGIMICVLYPYKKVSLVQERQMTTCGGNNTDVVAVNGNFDDCQRLVKDILEHHQSEKLHLSSANSINIARLIPQIVYYFKAYFELLKNKEIRKDEKIDFIVPTGNFGDILAGYLAKEMGLPINKLVCASNINNVLTEFLNEGCYDSNRPLHSTMSPSIDILVSSNLERLLYLKSKDASLVKELMDKHKKTGSYEISKDLLNELKKDFLAFHSNEDENERTIREYYDKYRYLIDTHTAVAASVADKYDGPFKKVILATASPYKFSKDVYGCLTGKKIDDDLKAMDILHEHTGVKIPEGLHALKDKEVRFKDVIEKDDKDLLIRRLEG